MENGVHKIQFSVQIMSILKNLSYFEKAEDAPWIKNEDLFFCDACWNPLTNKMEICKFFIYYHQYI